MKERNSELQDGHLEIIQMGGERKLILKKKELYKNYPIPLERAT